MQLTPEKQIPSEGNERIVDPETQRPQHTEDKDAAPEPNNDDDASDSESSNSEDEDDGYEGDSEEGRNSGAVDPNIVVTTGATDDASNGVRNATVVNPEPSPNGTKENHGPSEHERAETPMETTPSEGDAGDFGVTTRSRAPRKQLTPQKRSRDVTPTAEYEGELESASDIRQANIIPITKPLRATRSARQNMLEDEEKAREMEAEMEKEVQKGTEQSYIRKLPYC